MEPIVGLIDGEIVVQDMAFSISTLCAWPSTASVVFFAFDLLHSTGKISFRKTPQSRFLTARRGWRSYSHIFSRVISSALNPTTIVL
jgi:hypothetical protein